MRSGYFSIRMRPRSEYLETEEVQHSYIFLSSSCMPLKSISLLHPHPQPHSNATDFSGGNHPRSKSTAESSAKKRNGPECKLKKTH